MSREVTGRIKCSINFFSIPVEDKQNVLDAIFPDGWEGEMSDHDITITEDVEVADE